MSFIDAIIKIRSGTAAAAAASNLVLAADEPGWTTDTGVLKIGDGVTPWNSLPNILVGGTSISDGDKGDIDVSGGGANWALDAAIKAALRDRATHTGQQPAASISDFSTAVDARIAAASGAERYQHNQASSATTWTVNHNLGFRPQCEVFSPGWVQIEAAILHTTDNQTVITFNSAQTGQAIFT